MDIETGLSITAARPANQAPINSGSATVFHLKTLRRWRVAGFVAVVALALLSPANTTLRAAPDKGSVSVLDRVRLGTYIEETAFVASGPFAGQIAMLSGNEIYGVPANPRSASDLRKLFDIRSIGITVTPKGMAYIASEGVFAYVSGGEPEIIHITDTQGNRLPSRPIGYRNPFEPTLRPHPEGLMYLPVTSPWFPDHLLMVMNLCLRRTRPTLSRVCGCSVGTGNSSTRFACLTLCAPGT